jgi:flagellar hook-associated protein 1 FlgK
MSLTSALSIAQSALRNTSRQTSIVSRNVSDASNPDYTRRIAVITSTAPGARSVDVQRSASDLLFKNNLKALSTLVGQQTVFEGMDRLGLAVNGADNATSAATAIGKLQEALQTYSAAPSNRNLAENAVDAARSMVRTLNSGTEAIQGFRADMDSEISTAVGELNDLLNQFKDANSDVASGTRNGRDVSDSLDRRDALLKQISNIVGISTFTRADNDMVIMTKDGATLFETVPRTVTFQAQSAYGATTTGNAVYVDGLPIVGGAGGNTDAGGKIAGLIQLRDDVAGTAQTQLDEIARGLVTAFAETDGSGGPLPAVAGLFSWPGAPAIPPSGTLVGGLAGTISLNPAFDSDVGGDPTLLRDGGANGAGYIHNTGGGSSYADLLIGYSDALDQPTTFDAAAKIGTSQSVSDFSTSAISWFEGTRKDASTAKDAKEALASRTQEALSNATGVNVDSEMALLLDLEHTYEASARLIKACDDMLTSLLAAVR